MRVLVLLAYNFLRLLTWPLTALYWRLRRQRPRWVRLRLGGSLEELPAERTRLSRVLQGWRKRPRSVLGVRRLVDRARTDPVLLGLLLELEHVEGSHATLSSLADELARLREAGKTIVCFLPLGADQKTLYLASVADRVLTMPHASFSALGPLAARTYLGPLLARLGLDVFVTAEGRYKTAAEPLVSATMSEPERAQLEAIVGTLLDDWTTRMASRAQLGRDGAGRLLEAGVFAAREAEALKLSDASCYDDELPRELGLKPRERVLDHDAYLARSTPTPRVFVPLRPRAVVALVRLVGPIGARSMGRGIDLHSTTALLRRLADSPRIAGVILHIDSPGGSALISELLHRAICQLDARKPVVAWFGGVAASGGYYLAAAARAIVAQPTTLTGSIGVVSLRPSAERLLARLQVRREVVGLTRHADLHSFARPPSADEQAILRHESQRFYARFLEVVAAGRKRPREEIAELAEGRVWSGRDAHAHGLVDALGSYAQARMRLDAMLRDVPCAPDPVLFTPSLRDQRPPPPSGASSSVWGALGPLLHGDDATLDPRQASAAWHTLSAWFGGGDAAPPLASEWRALYDLLALASCGERVLHYAAHLPRV